jgi:hypothetical protein
MDSLHWKEASVAHTVSTESPLHEGSHIRLRTVIKFVVWFVIVVIAVELIVWSVFVAFRSAVNQDREITGVTDARLAPPEPRLQPSVDHNRLPATDLTQMRATEKEAFARRGWVDEKTGEIRVPEAIVNQVVQQSQAKK